MRRFSKERALHAEMIAPPVPPAVRSKRDREKNLTEMLNQTRPNREAKRKVSLTQIDHTMRIVRVVPLPAEMKRHQIQMTIGMSTADTSTSMRMMDGEERTKLPIRMTT